ncbi:MAG TPA: DUF84 family protein [Sphingobacteriaceae bacterium]|nr:DUF84 family protein [Sphingobacteriaceae bacterium]
MARARTRIRVKFSDTDATGTVYHGNFTHYMEWGRLEVLRRARPRHGDAAARARLEPLNFVIAHIELDFRSPVRFPDELEVDSWVRKIGNTSVSFGFRLRRIHDGVVVADGHDVIVFVDEEGRPTPVPSCLRDGLEAFIDPGPQDEEPVPVVVGSTNPAKIHAVRSALSRTGLDAVVEGVAVTTADAQPVGDEAIRRGAEERARQALDHLAARAGQPAEGLALGLESGLVVMGDDVYVTGWCVALDRQGRKGAARGAQVQLPAAVAQRVLAGESLADVIDELSGLQHSGTRSGAMGYLTGGAYDRRDAWEGAVALALAPFLRPDLYTGP